MNALKLNFPNEKREINASVIKNWEVRSNTSDYTLKRIVDEIDSGNKSEGGIDLKPFYQREYKFTQEDESRLIESLLGGIPIPTIYLASDTTRVPHISNVIDGQHRLFAVWRFVKNKFRLKGLTKFKELDGNFFSELHASIQNKLLYQISLTLQFIHTQDDPELEIEIFTRYNQGTNPLTSQEIRSVVYRSMYNNWIIQFVDEEIKKKEEYKNIMNLTSKRYNDKLLHQDLYLLFSIYKNIVDPGYSKHKGKGRRKSYKEYMDLHGINTGYYSSTDYVVGLMDYARGLNDLESVKLIENSKLFFIRLMDFLIKGFYSPKEKKYPFSKEIYTKIAVRNHKCQTSIMMIMVSLFQSSIINRFDINDLKQIGSIKNAIKRGFLNSKFPSTTSSTTEPSLLIETIETIQKELDKI